MTLSPTSIRPHVATRIATILVALGLAAAGELGAPGGRLLSFGALALVVGALAASVLQLRRQATLARAAIAAQQQRFDETLGAFVRAVESREPARAGHACRVRAYAEEMGKRVAAEPARFGLDAPPDDAWLEALSAAALLHDVGKLGVPEALLRQRDAESSAGAEGERYRLHAVIGASMVRQIPFAHSIEKAVRYHHERWDGEGFPDGLSGAAIPLEARIIGFADALDSLFVSRGDGAHPLLETIVEYVSLHSGTQLDPTLCELYCEHSADIERAVALRADQGDTGITEPMLEDTSSVLDVGRAQHEAGVLFDLACQLGTSLRVEETARTVLQRLAELVPARSCAMYVVDASGMHALPRAALGPLQGPLERRTFARGEGITGWVLETGEPALNVDPRIDLGNEASAHGFTARSATVIPVRSTDRLVGLLAFYGSVAGAFTGDHLRIIRSIVPQLAAALVNAELYETTHIFSMTDSLTGLPNSRYLYSQLDKEIARATRKGQPLVVTVLDLDGFKPINDTYGHQAGDLVLRQVGQLLQRSFRQGDTVCRYAGDEFVALLPETSPDEAETIVQRVQEIVSGHEFRLADSASVHVGISAGSACFPIDGSTLEQLVHRADKAMYRNKSERRQEHDELSRHS